MANKSRRHDVAHRMGNVRRKSKQTRKRARTSKSTSVIVPSFPWFNAAHLDVTAGKQALQLRAALRDVGKLRGKHSLSMQVHSQHCPWSVVLWPRASDCASPEADAEMRDAIERRDENCTCVPLIMYTGAMA